MSPYWTTYTLSLDSLNVADEDIFIAFRHTGTDGYILALDNIKVFVNDPVSVSEHQLSKVQISPNPFNNIIHLNVNNPENLRYQIIDISGKTIVDNVLNTTQLDLSILENGVYFLSVEGFAIEKIIKQ